MKGKKIAKGIFKVVLVSILWGVSFSKSAEAAESELTYDPNDTKPGYHLEIESQFLCTHNTERDTRTIVCDLEGLNQSESEIAAAVRADDGLNYTLEFSKYKPQGAGSNMVGDVVCVANFSGTSMILATPYICPDGNAAYAYFRYYFSYCKYTGENIFVAGQHRWLGCSGGDVGENEFHPVEFSHTITRYRFVPNHYNVAYNGNGATEGSMENQYVCYDQNFRFNMNSFKRDGYYFSGWNTMPDGSGRRFSNGQLVSNLAETDGGTVTLYAQWVPIRFQILFDGNGATSGDTPSMNCIFGRAYSLNANGFQKQYHINYDGNGGISEKDSDIAEALFNGWRDYNTIYYRGMYFNFFGFDGAYYVNKHPDVKRIWGYNKYETLNHWFTNTIANGTENRQASPWFKIDYYMQYGGSDLQAAFGTSRLHYVSHFMTYGIYENRKGADHVDTDISACYPDKAWIENLATRQGENVTLTADWISGNVMLPKAVREGYQFEGWYTEPEGGTFIGYAGASYTPENNGSTLYAHWKANTYTIHFEENGATGGVMEDIVAAYNADITLPANSFIRGTDRGESLFLGWSRECDATEAEFSDGETIRSLAKESGTVVILYAIWDDCPEIEAVNRYFSLDFAQKGKITEEELLNTASAADREDGILENRTSAQISEVGVKGSLGLCEYDAADFTAMTDSGSVNITYRAVDSSGNTYVKTITVFVTSTEPMEQKEFAYKRFINETYYGASYENGGLHPESVWKKEAEYRNALETAISNLNNNTPIGIYVLKAENE